MADFLSKQVGVAFTVIQSIGLLLLLFIWCLCPRWRSLQHYIGLLQILLGTIHSVHGTLDIYGVFHSVYFLRSEFFIYDYLIIHINCSLCALLIAHVKLVFIHVGRIRQEKRKCTLFIFGIYTLIKCMHWISYDLSGFSDGISIIPMTENFVKGCSIGILLIINLLMFINIIISVMSSPMRNPSIQQVISLIGVAIVCDFTLIVNWGLVTVYFYRFFFYLNGRMYRLLNYTMIYTKFRMIPLTLFFLFKRTTREVVQVFYRKQLNVWRARRSNLN